MSRVESVSLMMDYNANDVIVIPSILNVFVVNTNLIIELAVKSVIISSPEMRKRRFTFIGGGQAIIGNSLTLMKTNQSPI
jgi:hypothetical protein